MPSTRTICYYAMYVIGEVESNWNWTAVNYNDPITIGMMQWYGTRAAGLLNRIKDEMPAAFELLASSLKNDVNSHDASSSWWTSRYLTQAEGNSIVEVFQDKNNHTIQENQAISDFEGYISTLENWGMSQNNPKPLIFAMSMFHQSPASAGQVIQTAGGSADLDRIYTICLNHGVLGNYSNRYNTVYARLKDWDGESMPPDFGQSGEASSGGDSGGITTEPSLFNYILQKGDYLYLFGEGKYSNGIPFYPSGGQTWKCGVNATGATITGGNTGGGSATGSEAQNAVCEIMRSWVGKFDYSQGAGRLDPESSGYSDCSGCIWAAYHKACGVDCGTWTGDMANKGTLVKDGSGELPVDEMQPADIILLSWNGSSTFDHAECYLGNNELAGQTGEGKGPRIYDDARMYGTFASNWMVRRYL